MPRPTKIDRLPEEIRALIGRLRGDGRTIDEILAKLEELDVEVARSTMGRHVQELDRIAEEIRRSRAVAEAIVERFGEQPDNKTARLNIELAHSLVMKCMLGEDGSIVNLDPQEAMFVATSLQKLAQASKSDTERTLKITKEVTKKAADVAEDAAKEAGLSAERAAELRRKVLGVKTAGSA